MQESNRIIIEILRQEDSASKPYLQSIEYCIDGRIDTVANALSEINRREDARDVDGNSVKVITWECSCLKQKCGACAMVINGTPRLACEAFLKDFEGKVRLEPLKKFPLVKDLMVDRSIMRQNLREIKLWADSELALDDNNAELTYEASKCLQCGCCLEVCPNYAGGQGFFGAAAFVPTTRLLAELSSDERETIRKEYMNHIYAGCGKSLSCQDICPAGIDAERLLVKSNAIALKKHR